MAESAIDGTLERLAEGKFSEAAGHGLFSILGGGAVKAAIKGVAGARAASAVDDAADAARVFITTGLATKTAAREALATLDLSSAQASRCERRNQTSGHVVVHRSDSKWR